MKQEHINIIEPAKCIRCGLCEKDCPNRIIVIDELSAKITSQDCIKCGHCVAVCPQAAISISGFEEEPVDLPEEWRVDPDRLMTQVRARRSMRHFTEEDVPDKILENIIDAGRFTPTGTNRQATTYIVLRKNKDEYERIAVSTIRKLKSTISVFLTRYKKIEIGDDFLFKGAPVVIVIKSTDKVDGALAAATMELVAQAYGLGVLYSGFFSMVGNMNGKLKKKLGITRKEKIVTTLVLGYPAVKYQRTAQREKAVVSYD